MLLHGSLGDRSQWSRAGYVDAFRTIARVSRWTRWAAARATRPTISRGTASSATRATCSPSWTRWASSGRRCGATRWAAGSASSWPPATRTRIEALIATGASGHGYSPFSPGPGRLGRRAGYGSGSARRPEAIAGVMDVPAGWWRTGPGRRRRHRRLAAGQRRTGAARTTRSGRSRRPVLLLLGERDPVLEQARGDGRPVPRCVLVELEGLDHVASFTPQRRRVRARARVPAGPLGPGMGYPQVGTTLWRNDRTCSYGGCQRHWVAAPNPTAISPSPPHSRYCLVPRRPRRRGAGRSRPGSRTRRRTAGRG